MKQKGPLPPLVLLLAIILLVAVHFLLPRLTVMWYPANIAGMVPLVLGIYLNVAADRLLKRHQTTVKPFQESTALVTMGVYGHTRHPMYLGFTLMLVGIALLLGSVWPFVVVALFPWVLNALYIRVEETMLRDHFGQEWIAYERRVRKWL